MKIQPLKKRICIILEGTKDGKLTHQVSKKGIFLPAIGGMDGLEGNLGLQNRWAFVLEVGPECTEVQAGDRVCILAQKWTEGMNIDEEWIWFSDEEHVLLVDMLYRETNGKEKVQNEIQLGNSVHSL